MIIDGKHIAAKIFAELRDEIKSADKAPRLMVVTYEPNFETRKFLSIKKKRAEKLGVALSIIELTGELTTSECVQTIEEAALHSDGIVVQLPFPPHIERDALIAAIPATHDVDAFITDDHVVLPPVTGAIAEIIKEHEVKVEGARVVVVGSGKLVGAPAAKWLKRMGGNVEVFGRDESEMAGALKDADIIVLGAGQPGLLGPDMIKEGVVILDAGTSEAEGVLAGDADPRCAEKASVFTPVPGGIGPITVAVLFKNLVILAKQNSRR